MQILKDREITTATGEIITDITLDETQPDNVNRTTGTTENGISVVYQPRRGWMDATIADNSAFFGW